MAKKLKPSSYKTSFELEGELVGIIKKSDQKIKTLVVQIGDQSLPIKLSKALRKQFLGDLAIGERVQILGQQKLKAKTGTIQFKAFSLYRLTCLLESQVCQASPQKSCAKSGKILLCQKSGCLKKGGKQLHEALKIAIANLGLQDRVTIKATSCQKRCGKAPNMVFMPGKDRYGKISPKKVSKLLEEHFMQ